MLDSLYNLPARRIYSSLFRVYCSIHILANLVVSWPLAFYLYGNEGFIKGGLLNFTFSRSTSLMDLARSHYQIVLIIYGVISVLMLFGIGRNLTVFAVFFATGCVQQMSPMITHGGDTLLQLSLFFLSFMDSFGHLCIHPTVDKPIDSTGHLINNLAVISMMLQIMIMYFINGLAKAHADVWYNGVALYYILAMDRWSANPIDQHIVQSGVLVTVGTYFAMIWEIAFSFVVLSRAKRWVLLGGVLLHGGIYLTMGLHDFAFFVVMTYGFFLSDLELKNLYSSAQQSIKQLRLLPRSFAQRANREQTEC